MAAPRKYIAYFFSLAIRAGTMKAHSWYSQIGEARISPATTHTWRASMIGVPTPLITVEAVRFGLLAFSISMAMR